MLRIFGFSAGAEPASVESYDMLTASTCVRSTRTSGYSLGQDKTLVRKKTTLLDELHTTREGCEGLRASPSQVMGFKLVFISHADAAMSRLLVGDPEEGEDLRKSAA